MKFEKKFFFDDFDRIDVDERCRSINEMLIEKNSFQFEEDFDGISSFSLRFVDELRNDLFSGKRTMKRKKKDFFLFFPVMREEKINKKKTKTRKSLFDEQIRLIEEGNDSSLHH